MAKTTIGDFIVAIVGSSEIGRITKTIRDIALALNSSSNPRFKASARELQGAIARLLNAVGMEEVQTETGLQVVPKPDTEPRARLHIVGAISKANIEATQENVSDGPVEALPPLPEEFYAVPSEALEILPAESVGGFGDPEWEREWRRQGMFTDEELIYGPGRFGPEDPVIVDHSTEEEEQSGQQANI